MNKFINALLLLLLFPMMLLAIFVGFDLPISFLNTTGNRLRFHHEILLAFGLIISIIIVRRSLRRWMGVKLINQTSKFKWNQPISNSRIDRVQLYNYLEALVFLSISLALYSLTSKAWLASLAFLFNAIDNIVFIVIGKMKNLFRIGITSKAIMVVDREVVLIYFSGLRKVSIQQQTIYFDYIEDLQLSIPMNCITDQQKEVFFESISNQLDLNKVFITKNR